jgi:FtsP/CotA-like multicopper oxidase with cupredoxin domain
MGGLSGTLVIEGFQDEVPATRPLVERMMALKEFSPNGSGRLNHVPKPSHGTFKTINGQLDPAISMQPGETQLWRMSGQTADGYFRLRAKGLKLVVLGRDARPLVKPELTDEVLIGPSERVDVLATAGSAGRYSLIQEKTDTGPLGDQSPPQEMALVVVAADPLRPAPTPLGSLVINAPKQVPVSDGRIDAHRLVVFSEDVTTGLFFINHETFDPKRTDIRVPLGSIEEWTVRNASQELHVFHIHQVPFQVVSINGKPEPFVGLRDTIDVPIHGEVKIRMAFTDPRIVGRFMYHCHILEHEDKGMMATIEVYDPAIGPMPDMKMSDMKMPEDRHAG